MIVLVAGLPGSGKTTLLRQLEAEGFFIADDCNRNWRRYVGEAIQAAQSGKHVAISDIMFTQQEWRDKIEEEITAACPCVPFVWVVFENNPEQCLENAIQRNRTSVERDKKMIRHLARNFKPEWFAQKVYRP